MSSVKSFGGIFICYRREDTAGQAGRLYDRLSARFGKDRIFMDVDSIPFGVDFTEKIIGDLSKCNVLLALIGPRWSAINDSEGRRIDSPNDPVRIEIETALQLGIRVVPVLVDGAEIPQADDLPAALRPLTRYNAHELNHTSFSSDATRLIADIGTVIERRQPSRLTETRIRAPAVDVPVLAEALRQWYEDQGLEAILATAPHAVVVQCRNRGPSKRISGMSDVLTVILRARGEDLLVEAGSAKWLGKFTAAKVAAAGATGAIAGASAGWTAAAGAAAATVGAGVVGTVIIGGGAVGAAGVAVVWIGVKRREQYKLHRLTDQTLSCKHSGLGLSYRWAALCDCFWA